jgi:hypothetical protein
VLAVHEQRAGQPDRNLSDADELLDVARQDRRVERVARDVLEPRAGLLLDEVGAFLRGVARVVVLAVARDWDSLAQKITA